MLHVDEMTPEQRALYDRWVELGEPNVKLLVVRRTKEGVRLNRAHGVDDETIRPVVRPSSRRSQWRNWGA